jgi:hypothetical protein
MIQPMYNHHLCNWFKVNNEEEKYHLIGILGTPPQDGDANNNAASSASQQNTTSHGASSNIDNSGTTQYFRD